MDFLAQEIIDLEEIILDFKLNEYETNIKIDKEIN